VTAKSSRGFFPLDYGDLCIHELCIDRAGLLFAFSGGFSKTPQKLRPYDTSADRWKFLTRSCLGHFVFTLRSWDGLLHFHPCVDYMLKSPFMHLALRRWLERERLAYLSPSNTCDAFLLHTGRPLPHFLPLVSVSEVLGVGDVDALRMAHRRRDQRVALFPIFPISPLSISPRRGWSISCAISAAAGERAKFCNFHFLYQFSDHLVSVFGCFFTTSLGLFF
jgi:hypothetical protein